MWMQVSSSQSWVECPVGACVVLVPGAAEIAEREAEPLSVEIAVPILVQSRAEFDRYEEVWRSTVVVMDRRPKRLGLDMLLLVEG